MQNTWIKAVVIRIHCDLSLSDLPDTMDIRTACILNSFYIKI